MDRSHAELRGLLARHGQEHVLAFWGELNQVERERLAAQVRRLDLNRLNALFQGGAAGENWAELAGRATPPPAFRLGEKNPPISAERAIAAGHEALDAGHVGVILVAGGQGTRLGFDRPKGMYSIGPVSGASLFQILLEKVAARSRAAAPVPLYVMTSPATHDETVAYLAAHENFGLPIDGVRIFCQGVMPVLEADSGRLLLANKGELALSPDGHGGMLAALTESGCLSDIRRRGLRQIFYCQVDNPLVQMCDPQFLGYHRLAASELSTQVVAKRSTREHVGNVVSIDGALRILEYSDLNPLGDEMLSRRTVEGTSVFWAGNTAIHLFEVDFLERMAKKSDALPFHVAQKSVACIVASGGKGETKMTTAIKFERFIFDLLPAARRAIVVEVNAAEAFAPVKNAPGEAFDTPESVQATLVALYASWLRAAGCDVAPGVAVEVSPLFAQNAQELSARVSPSMVVTRPRYFC